MVFILPPVLPPLLKMPNFHRPSSLNKRTLCYWTQEERNHMPVRDGDRKSGIYAWRHVYSVGLQMTSTGTWRLYF